jgi:hypothetical protein
MFGYNSISPLFLNSLLICADCSVT